MSWFEATLKYGILYIGVRGGTFPNILKPVAITQNIEIRNVRGKRTIATLSALLFENLDVLRFLTAIHLPGKPLNARKPDRPEGFRDGRREK